jgi:hypothetical protein
VQSKRSASLSRLLKLMAPVPPSGPDTKATVPFQGMPGNSVVVKSTAVKLVSVDVIVEVIVVTSVIGWDSRELTSDCSADDWEEEVPYSYAPMTATMAIATNTAATTVLPPEVMVQPNWQELFNYFL